MVESLDLLLGHLEEPFMGLSAVKWRKNPSNELICAASVQDGVYDSTNVTICAIYSISKTK